MIAPDTGPDKDGAHLFLVESVKTDVVTLGAKRTSVGSFLLQTFLLHQFSRHILQTFLLHQFSLSSLTTNHPHHTPTRRHLHTNSRRPYTRSGRPGIRKGTFRKNPKWVR